MDVEDGEILESDDELPKTTEDSIELEVYHRIERPVAPRPHAQPPPVVSSDDELSPSGAGRSDDSDSDDGDSRSRKRRRPISAAVSQPPSPDGHNSAFAAAARQLHARRAARLGVWTAVLAEDGITSELASGLGHMVSGPRIERDVESYQLPEAAAKPRHEQPAPSARRPNDRKRGFQKAQQGWRKKRKDVVILKDLAITEDSPAEQVAADIALKLHENKPQIIVNIVRVVGIKKAIELFEETKSVEEGGGMLVNNWSRRRTPGGVYIQLLKTDPEVTEDQVKDVFKEVERERERERKKVKRARRKARRAELSGSGGGDGASAAVVREDGELDTPVGSDSDVSPTLSETEEPGDTSRDVGMEDGPGDVEAVRKMDSDVDDLEVPNEIVFD